MDLKTKQDLRAYCLNKRLSMPKEKWISRSKRIIDQVLRSTEYKKAQTIHCFVSMEKRREVHTLPLLERVLQDDKTLILPVTDFEAVTLKHVEVKDLHDLETNKWGVREPATGSTVSKPMPDLILVPLLAIDLKGNRLGYGKGFYDRFLGDASGSAMGLVFSDFIVDHVPVDAHDEPLDGFYSEKAVHYSKLIK